MALQKKTFTYGGLYNTASRYFRTELTLQELSIDPETNSSRLSYKMTLFSGNTRLSGYRIGARIFLGGKEYAHRDGTSYSNRVTIKDQSSVVLMQGELTVPHNADGTCKLTVSFSVYHPVVASYTPGNFTYTGGTMELTPIAKADAVFATDGYIGGVSMVVIQRKNKSYTHSLHYELGTEKGYLTSEGTKSSTEVIFSNLSVPFALPESFYGVLTSSKTGKCRLTCRTYSGENLLGIDQRDFTVMTPKSICAPQLTASVRDINAATVALTGNENTIVRFASQAECTLQASAQKGASIEKSVIEDVPCTQLVIDCPEKESYRFCVTDSRGYREETAVTAPFVPYVRLTAYPALTWNGDALTLTVTGSCFSGSFGATQNSLSLSCTFPNGRQVSLLPEITGETYRAEANLESIAPGETVVLTAKDKLMTVTENVVIPRQVPVFHWGESQFSVNVPAAISGVHMASAEGASILVDAPKGVLVCGAGVLGVADTNGWQGTEGVTVTVSQAGEMQIVLPMAQQVMLLSPGEMIIRK